VNFDTVDIGNFFNNDDTVTSIFEKVIKIDVIKRYGVCLVSYQILDQIRRQSS